jgi:hypothetical protein
MPAFKSEKNTASLVKSPRTLLASLVSATIFSACSAGESPEPDAWLGSVDTLASGEIHVSNPQAGLWTEEIVPRIEPDLRIGAVGSTGPDAFSAISLFEVDDEGRIWVLDDHSQEIRVFGRDGRFVRTIGGHGDGPGEFQMVTGMSWSPDGDLWVLDPGTLRFSVFDTSGTFLRSQRVEGGAVIIPWPGGFDLNGELLHYGRRPKEEGTGFELVMVRFYSDDLGIPPSDTLLVPRFESPAPFELQNEQRYMSVPLPFAPLPVWHLSPSGDIWWTNSADYLIHRSGQSGEILLTISKDFSPSPVTSDDLDTAILALHRFTEAGGRLDLSRIPDKKPALSDFFFDGEGQIWVIPYGEMSRTRPALDVFDPEGRYLGQVTLPFRFQTTPAPIVRGGYFYALATDELDVPFIVRGRIR